MGMWCVRDVCVCLCVYEGAGVKNVERAEVFAQNRACLHTIHTHTHTRTRTCRRASPFPEAHKTLGERLKTMPELCCSSPLNKKHVTTVYNRGWIIDLEKHVAEVHGGEGSWGNREGVILGGFSVRAIQEQFVGGLQHCCTLKELLPPQVLLKPGLRRRACVYGCV